MRSGCTPPGGIRCRSHSLKDRPAALDDETAGPRQATLTCPAPDMSLRAFLQASAAQACSHHKSGATCPRIRIGVIGPPLALSNLNQAPD